MLDDDKWRHCGYDMFKTQRALFTVQAFVRAPRFCLDERERWIDLDCSSENTAQTWALFKEDAHAIIINHMDTQEQMDQHV